MSVCLSVCLLVCLSVSVNVLSRTLFCTYILPDYSLFSVHVFVRERVRIYKYVCNNLERARCASKTKSKHVLNDD